MPYAPASAPGRRISLGHDRRGTVTILTAMAMVTLLCFLGLTVDVGDIYDGHRRLQGANDLAAVAAASNLLTATTAANTVAVNNGYQASNVTAVVTGIYTGDPTIPMNQRFVAAPAAVSNAAMVTMSNPQPLFLNNVFSLTGPAAKASPLPNTAQVGTQSMAVNAVSASFTVGSTLATVNGGVVNAVLGSLLGGNLSLSVMDYQSLVNAQIDLFQFGNALATQLHLTGITYKQLFSGSVTIAQFTQALQAAGISTGAAVALGEVATATATNSQTVALSQLINFGPFQNYQVGSAEVMSASLPASQLLTLGAQIADGGHQIALAINAGISGIATVTGTMTVGEPPVGTTMVTIGTTGASVHTAQTRLYLNIGLLSTLGAGSSAVSVPLYLELASATATVSAFSCNVLDAPHSSVTLAVTPAIANAWIGSVSPADMVNFSTEPTPAAAALVNVQVLGLGLLTVNGYANAGLTNMQPTNIAFSYSDITNDTVKSTDTQDYFASLFASLLGKIKLSATLLGLPVAVPTATANALGTVLAAAATPVDQLTNQVLQTVGVSLGVASTSVTGDHCAPAMVAQ